jgi:ketosteroid isomerase-like protein
MSGSKADIIRAIFAAYLANDRAYVAGAFTDDFRFTSPFDDNLDKPAYFERCWKDTGWIKRHKLETIITEGDATFVTYHCIARDDRSFRNTEFFRFAGDKVKRIDVYFGPSWQDGVFQAAPR